MNPAKPYQYHLQKYRGSRTRHTCPACGDRRSFTLYVDDQDRPLDQNVGKCDHISSCGYHKTPGEYFKENPDRRTDWKPADITERPQRKMMIIPKHYVEESHSINSTLMQWLINDSGLDLQRLADSFHLYLIGANKEGWTIWWQMDEQGRVRTGKIMRYDETGHRVKPKNEEEERTLKRFAWAHNKIEALPNAEVNRERDNTELQQCLFGLHLMRVYMFRPVAIVESEKTAFIMSTIDDSMVWMACGGLTNIKKEWLQPLIDAKRKIILFPDRDGWQLWLDKKKAIEKDVPKLYINYFARDKATDQDPYNADISDIMLRRIREQNATPDTYEAIQSKLSEAEKKLGLTEPHIALRMLIKKFDLIIKD